MNTDFIKVVDTASTPKTPSSPNIKFNIIAGFLIGLLLSIVVIFICEYYNTDEKAENITTNYKKLTSSNIEHDQIKLTAK